MTPEEIRIVGEGAAKRRKEWLELGLFIAWHVAAFTRTKRLPKWSTIQNTLRREPAKQMSGDEIKSFFKGIKDVEPPPLSEKEQKALAKKQKR